MKAAGSSAALVHISLLVSVGTPGGPSTGSRAVVERVGARVRGWGRVGVAPVLLNSFFFSLLFVLRWAVSFLPALCNSFFFSFLYVQVRGMTVVPSCVEFIFFFFFSFFVVLGRGMSSVPAL